VDGTEFLSGASGKKNGTDLLANLFARVQKGYTYVGDKYVPWQVQNPADLRETGNGIRPPMILSVGSCENNGRCIENTTSTGISVNDSSSGFVKAYTPSARMFVRFFAFADANQMPLRKIEIDWGDGRKYPLTGLFRNARGYQQSSCVAGRCQVQQIDDMSSCSSNNECASGRCILQANNSGVGRCLVNKQLNSCTNDQDCGLVASCVSSNAAQSFGTVVDQTCDNNYNQFEHVYQCARIPVDQGGYFHADPNECGGDTRGFPNGCCIYVPKVKVVDNWDWCNGSCPGGLSGNGCFDASSSGGTNECSSSRSGSWTSYDGKILVAPPTRLR
jgi:hypothetical protein